MPEDTIFQQGFSKTFESFDEIIGFDKLMAMHLNDSKKKCGTNVDRHDSLGDGYIGWTPFEMIMKDERFDGIPHILETPNRDRWSEEIDALKLMINE